MCYDHWKMFKKFHGRKKDAKKEIGDNPIIYYAHPMGFYGSKLEKKTIELIKKRYPNGTIINPGLDEYQGYPMNYYEGLAGNSDLVVSQPYDEKMIGAGVAVEILSAQYSGVPVEVILGEKFVEFESFDPFVVLTISETRAMNISLS